MVSTNKYNQFFRFRSPINVFEIGELSVNPILWMAESIKYIDYDLETYLSEAYLVMYYSKGGVSLSNIENTPLDIFEMHIKEAKRIQAITEKEENKPDYRHGE
jgi:hypothetical protein